MERCKMCRSAYFCSEECRKEYEPFRKRWCKQNQFADAMENDDPKFAEWMRKHGRQAVIRDEDVYRMQVVAMSFQQTQVSLFQHKEVWEMDEMYGKAQYVPQVPEYSQAELDLMKQRAKEEAEQKTKRTAFELAWGSIDIPDGLS